MRNHQLDDGLCQLTQAIARFERQCGEAEELWQDSRSAQFRNDHLPELKTRIQHLINAVHTYMATIDESQRDLSDEAQGSE